MALCCKITIEQPTNSLTYVHIYSYNTHRPMENIKTQLQLMKQPIDGSKPKFTGMIGGFRYNINTHGFLSLYRGLDVTLIGSIPKAGIRFGANAYFKELLKDENGKLTSSQQFLAGVGAGTTEAILAVTPMETVKTKLIETNTNFVTGVRMILSESGVAGLYQGLTATILKQSTNQGFRFMAFNKYKDILSKNGERKLSAIESLLGGMMAGCFSTVCNNPFDVVKTQMQGLNAKQYTGTIDCFKKIAAQEGVSGFYKGVVPRLGRVVPGQGVIFMSYETILEFTTTFLKK